MTPSVPTFYLYGEPHRLVDEGFVHAESLADRSRPSEWTIAPHSHAELNHVFAMASGGGTMRADVQTLHFAAPCLILVPAMTVHGFEWLRESTGSVITMSMRYVEELGRHDPGLPRLFDRAAAVPLAREEGERAIGLADQIVRELGWSAPGHRAAVGGAMLSLLVMALRHVDADGRPVPRPGNHVSLVARLRERIEQRFRLREPVAAHAAALGVSETALRVACARVAGSSPGQMLDHRALLEARRALLYSNMAVAEIGFALGFEDPAYFSRFFARNVGMSPRRYRETQGREAPLS